MGGGHKVGGHTELSHIKIPDYSIYKVTKDKTPELWEYKERLAREGLTDPWIRNLVWRYQKSDIPLYKRFSCLIAGTLLGFGVFGYFVYIDKTKHCKWHHPHEEKYKLLYQMNGDQSNSHHSHH